MRLRKRSRRSLPIPPLEMRRLVGAFEPEAYENPSGELVYPYLGVEAYEHVLDFGCGCGRIARQLIQQDHRPQTYLGVDLHRGMIDWCNANLAPRAEGFRFAHHDVHNLGLNPDGKARTLPLPAADATISLLNAWSVFTHLAQDQAEHYLREARRVLRTDGVLHTTWFLFEKSAFPMMQDFQNALFINETDPSNAVIFDRSWLRATARSAGLTITWAQPPEIRGFAWRIIMRPACEAVSEIEFPPDRAAPGRQPPPLGPQG